jgi:hypothetical protein
MSVSLRTFFLQHTDATSHEYDGTMTMLEQVDSIVRRIEDEKSSQEQRIKTRDALARIDGLDNDKVCDGELVHHNFSLTVVSV